MTLFPALSCRVWLTEGNATDLLAAQPPIEKKPAAFEPDVFFHKVIKANCEMSYPFEFTVGSNLHEGL